MYCYPLKRHCYMSQTRVAFRGIVTSIVALLIFPAESGDKYVQVIELGGPAITDQPGRRSATGGVTNYAAPRHRHHEEDIHDRAGHLAARIRVMELRRGVC